MHKLAITQSLLDVCIRYAKQASAQRIFNIHLIIGNFLSTVHDFVQYYWDTIAKEKIADEGTSPFWRVLAEMTCPDCENVFEPNDEAFPCPKCLSPIAKVTEDDELRVDGIDVEKETEPTKGKP